MANMSSEGPATLIHSITDQLVQALGRAASPDHSIEDLTSLLEAAFSSRNRIDAAFTQAVASLDSAISSHPDGSPSLSLPCASWLAHNFNLSSSSAQAQVHLARRLPSLPSTSNAFSNGHLSASHAGVVCRIVDSVARAGGDLAQAEALMLQEAGRRDPRDLLRWGFSLVHRLAPQELISDEERRHRRRHLHLAEAFDGGFLIDGYLDPLGGATLKTALHALLGPRPKGDDRSPGQRRADGLVELAKRALDSGQLPQRAGQRPHITLTATAATLCGHPGSPAALLDWGFPISGHALRKIAVDASITPILLSESGDPLHVGRRYRTATPKMRKALAERDRVCVWPGCDRPPDWCQADHVVPWAKGGLTEVEGMRLLCGQHNRKLNEGWRLEMTADRQAIVHPP